MVYNYSKINTTKNTAIRTGKTDNSPVKQIKNGVAQGKTGKNFSKAIQKHLVQTDWAIDSNVVIGLVTPRHPVANV